MRRWIVLGEHDDNGTRLGTLDNEGAGLDRVVELESEGETPSQGELAEALEGYDGEFLLLPIDAAKVIVAKTTTEVSVDVQVSVAGAYS